MNITKSANLSLARTRHNGRISVALLYTNSNRLTSDCQAPVKEKAPYYKNRMLADVLRPGVYPGDRHPTRFFHE